MSEKRKQQTGTNPLEAKLSAAEASNKRAKGAINSIAKEYVCPIALELPVDPVTAEDGRVYNRADIQQHIDNSKRNNLLSAVLPSNSCVKTASTTFLKNR